MLTLFINRSKSEGSVEWCGASSNRWWALFILQYADDTILFLECNLEQAHNMKIIFCAFEQLLGPKINFYKSEIFCFGEAKNFESQYMKLIGCNLDTFPILFRHSDSLLEVV